MHFWTEDPILFVEEARMRNIDPQKPENLFGMWSVFSKASGIMENGKRLENLTWRLWQQQTLCPKPKRKARPSATLSRPHLATSAPPPQTHLPDLSSSVDSACSSSSGTASKDSSSKSLDLDQRSGEAMCCVSDNDITPAHLESLVISIKEKQELNGPLSPLTPSTPRMSPSQQDFPQQSDQTTCSTSPRNINIESSASTIHSSTTESTYLSPTNASETSVGSDSSHHSIVRGFEPRTGISTYRSQSQLAPSPTPILKSSPNSRSIPTRKKGGVFQVGASSGEDESSFREHMSAPRSAQESTSVRTSSIRESSSKKQISFMDQVSEAPKKKFMFADDDDGAAIESDSDDDDSQDDEEVSESAIDDDDAWEDEGDAEDPPKQIEFHRVESKPDLVSRRSLLTDNLHENSRASALQNAASKSSPLMRRSRTSTPNGPSMPASPTEDSPMNLQGAMASGKLNESQLSSKSRPVIAAPTTVHPPCPPMSPRATRRNMVSQELGVSLRKHMLNERQYKNVYANNSSPLRRAHTATDVRATEQPQEPGPVYPMSSRGPKHGVSNDDFDHDLSDYHRKGW